MTIGKAHPSVLPFRNGSRISDQDFQTEPMTITFSDYQTDPKIAADGTSVITYES